MTALTKQDVLQLLREKHNQLMTEGNDWHAANEIALDLITESPEGTYSAKLKGKRDNAYITELANVTLEMCEECAKEGLTKEAADAKIRGRLSL
jgi:hypothetical protein